MKYFVTKDENDNAIIVNPVPPSAATYSEFFLLLNELPTLASGYKYVIANGELTTAQLTQQEIDAITAAANQVEFEKIDAETRAELANGFGHNQNTFPLDQESQNLYMRLYMDHLGGNFVSFQVPTINHGTYNLTDANAQLFFDNYNDALNAINEAARVKKESVLNS